MKVLIASLLSTALQFGSFPAEITFLDAQNPAGEVELKINVVKEGIKLLRPIQQDYIILSWEQIHQMEELSKKLGEE